MADYKRRLRRIWVLGFFGLLALMGFLKWQQRQRGESTQPVWFDVAATLLVALTLPTLIAVRGYYRYRKFLGVSGLRPDAKSKE